VFSPDTKVNPGSRPLKFTLSNLDARDILSLTGSARVRTHLTALRKALDCCVRRQRTTRFGTLSECSSGKRIRKTPL